MKLYMEEDGHNLRALAAFEKKLVKKLGFWTTTKDHVSPIKDNKTRPIHKSISAGHGLMESASFQLNNLIFLRVTKSIIKISLRPLY